MNKKISLLALVSFLLLSGFMPAVSAFVVRPQGIIVATIGEPETVDPAWAYDTASEELIFNVYDRLVSFAVDRALPPELQGQTGEFVPSLATSWTISPDRMTYTFTIREDVLFHYDAPLTTEDVEYTFERAMVQDRSGGPIWMLYEPLLGRESSRNPETGEIWPDLLDGTLIENAITHTDTTVTFNLEFPYPPFLQILCQPWASIVKQDWCIANGCWPHTWENWPDYNNPVVSPLDFPSHVMCGTGPYMFHHWFPGEEWSIVWNPDYWGGWPAPLPCQGSLYPEGWIETVTTVMNIPDWATMRMMFLAGDIDFCYVPRPYIPQLIVNWPEEPEIYPPGVTCFRDLPMLALDAMFFNFNVSIGSPYLGPGFDPEHPYEIADDRIPINFSDDIDVRRGFAYSFDYNEYIAEAYLGEATRPPTCVVEGLPCYNPAQPGYNYNLALAEACFQNAWGGQIWANGFNMTITYNTGNVAREIACYLIEQAVEDLNELFHINVVGVDWRSYLRQLAARDLTLYMMGWLADYPDCYDFLKPFMHSQGALAQFQSYSNPYVDELIEEGKPTSDEVISHELQGIYHYECISVPLVQPVGRHWERDWVMGWYYNPIYGGSHAVGLESTAPADPVLYFYHLWKGYRGDNDRDYDVDIDDLYLVLIWYCEPVPPAPPEYDWDKDGHVDLDDLYDVLVNYGK